MIKKITINKLQIEIFNLVAGLTNMTPDEVAKDWCVCPNQAAKFRAWFENKELEKYKVRYRVAGKTKREEQLITYHELKYIQSMPYYYCDIMACRLK
jgi:hypothetical protein